jgi:hypothetical protein
MPWDQLPIIPKKPTFYIQKHAKAGNEDGINETNKKKEGTRAQ